MQKILVTGVSGFVGPHLAQRLKSDGHYIVGIGHEDNPPESIIGLVDEYKKCDLTDKESVSRLELSTIDSTIHLAGLAAVGPSFDQPTKYIHMNSAMLINIAEQCLSQSATPRIIVVSTGALYDPSQPMPLTEESKVALQSPYAISKLTVEHLAAYYRTRGLDTVTVRPFNHIGPGQAEGFLLPDIYLKLCHAQTESNQMRVGNLSTRRDYTDVRDVVKAYALLINKKVLRHTTYNICSGASISGETILELLMKELNVSNVEIFVDQKLFRPSDATDLYGDNSRIIKETGWKPSIPLEQTIRDFIKSKE